jgi:hypothetical protein
MSTLQQIIKTAESKGYTIDRRPFKLNIIGVRNAKSTNQDTFDDQIAYFYYDSNGQLRGKVSVGTTDPSTYWLNNPMNVKGAAILKSGEYKDAYAIGLHKGQYTALVQVKPVTTIRDDDRNAMINYFAPTSTGLYGINIHRATLNKQNKSVIGLDSAGCQVFRDVADYNEMIDLAKKSRERYGNKFSYILIDELDNIKFKNTSLLIVGLGLIVYSIYSFIKNKK